MLSLAGRDELFDQEADDANEDEDSDVEEADASEDSSEDGGDKSSVISNDASDEELAQTAGLFGVHVTTQAVEQRFTPRLAAFLEALFRKATGHVISTQKAVRRM